MAMTAAGILAATVTLSGCMGPTYGTDKPAMAQLGDDLGAAVALGSGRDEDKAKIRYNPRPQLVVAGQQQAGSLPAPQQSLANRENNPNWVESPEETRARLRQEAEDNEKNQNYRSPLLTGRGQAGQMTETEKWEAFRQARQNAETTDVTARRRSLSEPPAEYRSADAGTLTDLGEPESKKEARRKKEAQAAGTGGSSWWKPFQ
ncbi:hypothetical protein [Rhizobium sp. NFR07]|uniref:hypothetical protein n=1 Tax=Rhizobium sp. NFR07 TaxID=1566262 RepID=UPI001FCCF04A|nr:hypothetical protein [Rhizobium sp. NFR07]